MTEITYLAPSDTPASGSVTLTGTGTFSIPGVTATGDVTMTVDAAQLMEALMLSLSIQSLSLGAQQPPAASVSYPDPSNIQSVGADGWTATYFLSGETAAGTETWASDRYAFDPDTPALAVQRSGYDANGDAATHVDLIAVNTEVRKPWAAFNTLDRVAAPGGADARVALSDWIYAGDVILNADGSASGVTNSSTASAPLPQAMWLIPQQLKIEDSSALTLTLFTDHRHARGGKPVAAVKMTATDGATTVTGWATLGAESWAASGLSAPVWSATLDVSTLNDGEIACDATIYPWVGSAVAMSSLHADANKINTGALTLWKADADVPRYAYISTGGSSGGTLSTNAAAARANPFSSVFQAITAANAAFGADTSGLVFRYEEGTFIRPGLASLNSPDRYHIVFEGAEGTDPAAVVITSFPTVSAGDCPDRALFRNLTLKDNGTDLQCLRGTGASSGSLVLMDCILDSGGAANNGLFIQGLSRIWAINCARGSGDLLALQLYGSNFKMAITIGCNRINSNSVWGTLGSVGGTMSFPAATASRDDGSGGIASFCHLVGGGQRIINGSGTMTYPEKGVSISGTVVESTNTSISGPAVFLWADSNAASARNINLHCTTIWGDAEHGRMNMLYLDGATYAPALSMSMRFSTVSWCPSKSGVFAGENAGVGNDGVEYGNWPVIFRVGHRANAMTDATYALGLEPAPGPGSWSRETDYPGLQWGDLDPDWTDDQSGRTAGSGYGDYRPGALTDLGTIPAGLAPFPVDHLGQAIPNDGSARIGALQPVAA